MTSPIELRTQR